MSVKNNNNGNDWNKMFQNLSNGLNNVNTTVNQNGHAVQKRLDNVEEHISAGFAAINSTVNQNGQAAIKQTRISEANLSKKLDAISGAFTALDWLTVLLVSILGGVIGWLVSNVMIENQFAPWVKVIQTWKPTLDAAGNVIGFSTVATSAQTVVPVVIITIVIFAMLGFGFSTVVLDSIRRSEK